MPNLSSSIILAENKWLNTLSQHIKSLYANVHLPSHDFDHHARVWGFCKQLFKDINLHGVLVDELTIEHALIACFFHDTGLIIEKSEKHGYHSRLLCEQFFAQNLSLTVENLDKILYAIEHHDDKTLKVLPEKPLNPKIDLLTLVSTADDLDAFGHIGVFRYLEIYTIRNLPTKELPKMVMVNIANRFANFCHNYSMLKSLLDNQTLRYRTTNDFFRALNHEVSSRADDFGDFSSISKTITNCLIDEKLDIKTAIAHGLLSNQSANSINFFISLKDELDY